MIADIYNEYAFITDKDIYTENEREHLASVGDGMPDTTAHIAINRLCQYLQKYYGKSFQAPIDEQIVFSQLDGNINAVWSLLVASGYLKIIDSEPLTADRKEKPQYTMKLTNTEVFIVFEDMVRSWFAVDVSGSAYNDFVKAMLLDDVEYMNEFMNEIALDSFSSFDVAKGAAADDHPERFYHGFVLGLIVGLRDRFEITSNRESGFGRYDVVLNPRNRERDNAYIIEFKVFRASKEKGLKDTVAKRPCPD